MVLALAVDEQDALYAGVNFGEPGGVSGIARWDGTAWYSLGEGISGGARTLMVDDSGLLYAGGLFDAAGGISVASIARV